MRTKPLESGVRSRGAPGPATRLHGAGWDPLLGFYFRVAPRWYVVLVVALLVIIVPKVALSAASNVLSVENLWDIIAADLRNLPLLASLFNWFGLGEISPEAAELRRQPVMPYLRDYVDIALSLICAAQIAIIFPQFRRLMNIISRMRAIGSIDSSSINDSELRQLVW